MSALIFRLRIKTRISQGKLNKNQKAITLNKSLKKKFEEEHRDRIVSEALRKPKQPLPSNVRQGLLDSGGF